MRKIYVWGRMIVPAAQEEKFLVLLDDLLATVRTSDPATVSIGIFEIPEEPGSYLVQEVYADADAQWAHFNNVSSVLGRIADLGVTMDSFNVAGDPSPEAREGFDSFGVAYWPVVNEL